jgi:CheY-like chemotaxis protein/HPt (histidine-containing phosphotransfer) domain-containing protein
MNGIIGMAEIGLESVINEGQRNILSTIKKEADVLNEIINDILDLSKIEAGKIELEEIPLDLRMLIADLSDIFSYRCIRKNLTLESSGRMDGNFPYLVLGDPTRLRQIFTNLIGNAIKFTPEGGKISIGCELAGDSADSATYKFLVSDTGIGIPRDKHDLIFNPFTQVDGSTTRKYGGTGLGTTIAKQLVDLMGGEIGIESEPGAGSTFWFVIPLKKQQASANLVMERESDLKKYTICLVSDTKQCQGTVDDLLFLGCTPLQATVHEAQAMLGKFRAGNRMPDLIILDCDLPETDIFAHARDIRIFLADDAVPLMIIMRKGSRGDGKRCREEVVQAYLTKPAKRSDLHKAIVQVVSDRKTGSSTAPAELVTKHSLKEICGTGRRILLVEDYPTNQKIALIHLQSQAVGCDVDLAENGLQAVSAFERKAYDLIFMDVQMPVMDGYEAVREIRRKEHKMNVGEAVSPFPRKARTPIIAMTAHAMMGDREKCLAEGMDDYIAKPIRKAELVHMVDKWLSAQQSLPTGTAPAESVPANTKESSDPLDLKATIKEFEGNRTMVSAIIQEFLSDVDARIVKMGNGVGSGELEIVRKEAHSIKGGAANINAHDLSMAASNLEQAAKASHASICGDLLQDLSHEAQRVNAYVTDLRARGLF